MKGGKEKEEAEARGSRRNAPRAPAPGAPRTRPNPKKRSKVPVRARSRRTDGICAQCGRIVVPRPADGGSAAHTDAFRWLLERPISHRGLHSGNGACPENSLIAFIRSAGMGFPIELDVRLLADGKVAVFHDEDTLRMTGSRHFIRILRSRELKRFGLLGTVHRIPLLDEVLDAVNGKVPLLIELKPSKNGGPLGEALLKTLEGYGGEHALQSFDPKVVLWLRRNAPNTPRGQLAGDIGAEGVRPWKSFLVERRLADLLTSPDFFGCGVERLCLRAFRARRGAGIPVLGWTVRSAEVEKKLRSFCDNIIFEGYIPKGSTRGAEEARDGACHARRQVAKYLPSRLS